MSKTFTQLEAARANIVAPAGCDEWQNAEVRDRRAHFAARSHADAW